MRDTSEIHDEIHDEMGMRYMYMYLKFIQGLEIHPGRK